MSKLPKVTTGKDRSPHPASVYVSTEIVNGLDVFSRRMGMASATLSGKFAFFNGAMFVMGPIIATNASILDPKDLTKVAEKFVATIEACSAHLGGSPLYHYEGIIFAAKALIAAGRGKELTDQVPGLKRFMPMKKPDIEIEQVDNSETTPAAIAQTPATLSQTRVAPFSMEHTSGDDSAFATAERSSPYG